MPSTISISPSSVIRTIGALKQYSGELHTLGGRAARVSVSGTPEPLGSEVTCALGTAANTLATHGSSLGAKAVVLQKKIDALIAAESAETAGVTSTALTIGDKGLGFAAWLAKHHGKQVGLSVRLDAYAQYVELRSGRQGLFAMNAWRSVLVEVSVLDNASFRAARLSYHRAAMAAVRDAKGGKVDYALISRWRKKLRVEARARVPKVPRAASWLHKVKLIPVLGSLADGYVGYKESAGSTTSQKVLSGANNAAGNVLADVATLSVYSWADLASTPTKTHPSDVVKVEADAQVLAAFGDATALARLHAQVRDGQKGKLPAQVWGSWSEARFVSHYLAQAGKSRR